MQQILEQLILEGALLSVTTVDGNALKRVKIQKAGSSMVILGYPNGDASRFFVPYSGIAWIEKHRAEGALLRRKAPGAA